MLNTDLALVGNGSTVTYSLTSIVDGKSIRKNAAGVVGQPQTLTISHGVKNQKDPKSPYRHLFRLDHTKQHAVTGADETASIQLVLEIPQSATFDDAAQEHLKLQLTNFLLGNSGAEFNKFQAGEP